MIYYDDKQRFFHLKTQNTSYIFRILPSGHLSQVFYGARIDGRIDIALMVPKHAYELGSSTSYSEESKPFSLNTTLLECPTYGKGDYRDPMVHMAFFDGSRVSDFLYLRHKMVEGKPKLDKLPHAYSDDGQTVQTLLVTLYDEVVDVYVELSYSVFPISDVISRSAKVINGEKEFITLEKMMSFNFDHYDPNFELITLDGAWIKERHVKTRSLGYGITKIDSKKGTSSSDHNPYIALKRKSTDESVGECFGFTLVYSGNFEASVEISPYDFMRVQMGINSFDFSWHLKPKESFQTPEVLMTYSASGLNALSHNFHHIIQNNLINPTWKNKERPILINNWEATYFDFTERKLVKLAKQAKKLGIELFVLDDGWFGKRNNDTRSLGDYSVNKSKLKEGLEGLAMKINRLGLGLGIWVEPEMVSVDSDLYRAHPDWAVQLNNRAPSFGRNQLILDFTRPDVRQYVIDQLRQLFNTARFAYCKWDMNRNFSDIFSNYLETEQQNEFAHRYVLGLYEVLETLTKEYPKMLFESCSSGGNRFDLGMLYYMPQVWTSDNTDPIERIKIQYGTSYAYPLSTMGAHVSQAPHHQTLRRTPLETRFNVAAFGILGYELDLSLLTRVEKNMIKNQVAFYKEHRRLFQFGKFYRLKNPFENNQSLWMVVSEDMKEAMVGYYQTLHEPNYKVEKFKLKGLNPKKTYRVNVKPQWIDLHEMGDLASKALPIKMKARGVIFALLSQYVPLHIEKEQLDYTGSILMHDGITPKQQFSGTGYNELIRLVGDFGSRIYHIKEGTS